jgi:hypothetical protein
MPSARGATRVTTAIVVALTLLGCGENNPGDPLPVARDLASPMPPGGRADVYCNGVPPMDPDDPREECSIDLKLPAGADIADAEVWLIAVGQRVRPLIGRVFTFDGRPFFWDSVFVERAGDAGGLEFFCAGEVRPVYYPASGVTPPGVLALPETSSWFESVADARTAGCRLALDDRTLNEP